ncbi:putative rRNA maturation factor [Pedobacter africanus]|uniref:rRNA maturation RNase YbeY n=1 Tax=Pedobacter africanus TaxID=151894 RepID=A0ACC6KW50_9SPHI|nr:rRNA maturation RNase YbeY [Pedobacter africanus]MDR6783564.1 rRNA maturation RNase YbeY [Pedobacter africanus]
MSKAKIHFFTEDITYTLKKKTAIKDWLKLAVTAEGYVLEELNFIFCSDEYLLRINQEYLQHDDYTDVITFDNSEQPKTIVGDIFISIERIRENAKGLKVAAHDELCRVIIHGTLHLLGYKDKGKAAKLQMTAREDHYLSLLQNS